MPQLAYSYDVFIIKLVVIETTQVPHIEIVINKFAIAEHHQIKNKIICETLGTE